MGHAKQTTARLIDQRARRRATQALINLHPEEWRDLYEEHRRKATTEAQLLAVKATETRPTSQTTSHTTTHAATHHETVEPPRLMTGRRKPGQDATDRIDVARCPQCVSYHDSGHACPNCGSEPGKPAAPAAVPPIPPIPPIPRDRIDEAILRMVAQGHHDAQIAFDLRLTEEAVKSRRKRLGLAREEAS